MDEQVNVLLNLANSLVPVEKLVTGAAYLLGILFVMKAFILMKEHGESRGQNAGGFKEVVAYLFVGGLLVYFPSAFQMLMRTTFGYENALAYAPSGSNSTFITALFAPGNELGSSLAIIIQLVGVISFVRGWILIVKASSGTQAAGGGGTGKGLTHVFGGILAMNIIGTLQVFSNTLYGAG